MRKSTLTPYRVVKVTFQDLDDESTYSRYYLTAKGIEDVRQSLHPTAYGMHASISKVEEMTISEFYGNGIDSAATLRVL